MLANQARRFGETLVDRHVLSRDDLEQAIEESERNKDPLPSVLLRLALVGSKELTAELARQYVPMAVDFEGQKLVVAFAEPPSATALSAVGHATSFEVIPAVADRSELMRAIAMIYGAGDGEMPEFDTEVVVGDQQLDDELHIN